MLAAGSCLDLMEVGWRNDWNNLPRSIDPFLVVRTSIPRGLILALFIRSSVMPVRSASGVNRFSMYMPLTDTLSPRAASTSKVESSSSSSDSFPLLVEL